MADQPMHPATAQLLQFFTYAHLPPALQQVARPLSDLAWQLAHALPPSAELTVGLRKLLEAKDCFVRAALEDSRDG
jgi:hypothetical protein